MFAKANEQFVWLAIGDAYNGVSNPMDSNPKIIVYKHGKLQSQQNKQYQ